MRVLITRKAEKQLDKIPEAIAKKITKDLISLTENPYPQNSKKLAGKDNYRLRIGVYRVIYSIDKKKREVTMLRIKHRREVYR